jgi:type I restriction-modification system DNA methylase subunit
LKQVTEIKVEEEIFGFIKNFVNTVSNYPNSDKTAKNLSNVLLKIYDFPIGDPHKIKDAILAQAGLALLLSSLYYEIIRHKYNFISLKEILRDVGGKAALEQAIEWIVNKEVESIFSTTNAILKEVPSIDVLFFDLIKLAIKLASQKSLLRTDFVGKIYHDIVGDWAIKKGLAVFFTQIPSAHLLLKLANPELVEKNGKPKFPRICDFACGSGTLLIAAYSVIRSNFILRLLSNNTKKTLKEIDEEFHKAFIKNCYAFDVLKYATQIACLILALHCPEIPLEDFKSYTLPLGIIKESGEEIISLGSLEFARSSPRLDSNIIKIETMQKGKERLFIEPFDLVVMNPPFTGTSERKRKGRKNEGLFGFMTDKEIQEKVKKDYQNLSREEIKRTLETNAINFLKGHSLERLIIDKSSPYRKIWPAGEPLPFLFLAHKYTKVEGKIGFVLPKSFLSGISWFLARILLISDYHIETIVVSYDSNEGYNFSVSTDLSECLLIATKKSEHTNEEKTKFVMLLNKPKTDKAAINLANKIVQGDNYAEINDASAFIISVEREELLDNLDNWGRFVSLPNLKILEILKQLHRGKIRVGEIEKGFPQKRLDELISTIGINRCELGNNFNKVENKVSEAVRILYGGGEENRKRMSISPNHYVLPIKRGKKIFQEKAGHLLVPDRIRWDTTHAISLLSKEKTLGNMFFAINLKNESQNKLKALCLWLNTTWGILTVLSNRQETEGAWTSLVMGHWKTLPVLDVDEISKECLEKLAQVFDSFKKIELGRIPHQYNVEKGSYVLRRDLDNAFLKALGINVKEEDLTSLYQEIHSSLEQWIG